MASNRSIPLLALSELQPGQEADFFALMTLKESLQTRENKPYFKVGFRDALREVQFPVWGDAPFAEECRDQWSPGACYKLRAIYRETSYGPQLDIRRIRAVSAADIEDGFDPLMFLPQSRFDIPSMFRELCELAEQQIAHHEVRSLVRDLLDSNQSRFMRLPAAVRNHHTYVGGLLEHVLSVTRTCVFLSDKYDAYYPDLAPRLCRDVVIAGAILHDIGKLRELTESPIGANFTSEGSLIGHVLQGRDMLREAAVGRPIPPELLLRLEHVIVSHQRLPEWGSPKPPMTPEALLVHYADDLDAKYHMMYQALRDDTTPGALTSKKNVLGQQLFRGE